ncbi:MAG: Zn-ribbon domain-containing OB-fold protein [Dehalococcoidia bacterium]|jgi:uncharacterized protein
MEHKLTFKDYNAALKQNKLVGLKCQGCGEVTVQPRLACRKCGSTDLIITDLKGVGIIQSFTVMNVAPEGMEARIPYIVVLVELNEGPWIMGNLSGIAPADATMDLIGTQVTMEKCVAIADKYCGGEVAGPVFARTKS